MECLSTKSNHKTTMILEKAEKPTLRTQERVLKGTEVIKFSPPGSEGLGAPTSSGESDSDCDNDSPVSRHMIP